MRIQHLILAVLIAIVWGFNFVVIEIGLHEIPPLLLCAIRFLLTGIPAALFFKRPAIPIKLLALYGLTTFALQFGFLFAGIYAGIAPGLASLILQIQVFFTVILGALFLHEKPNQWQIVGILIAFAGIGFIGLKLEDEVSLLGFIFVLLAGVAWSIGNLTVKKIKQVNMLALVIWGNLLAFPPMLISAFCLEGQHVMLASLHHLTGLTLAAIIYLVYVSTMFGYGSWSWLLNCYPIATVIPYALLVPILGLLSSALVLHEPLQTWKLLAGLIIIAGLCVNFLGPHYQAKKLIKKQNHGG